ncbi:MAG: NUDIX domain-containing protein [Epsilonproteobacteria bacterium]|nr:NUDIX domain-containing protein [Campylobacterota bacterium]
MKKIKDIEIISTIPKPNPQQIAVYELTFKEKGRLKRKEVTKSLEVVKILIYHKKRDAFVLIRQFRPLVYINSPLNAIRYELCGGRVDKPLSIEEIAKEEVLEEVGYRVERLKKVTTLVTGNRMHLFYCEVEEKDRVDRGGGVGEEEIEVIYLPTKEAKEFMFDESKPKRPALMFMFCWWFHMRED